MLRKGAQPKIVTSFYNFGRWGNASFQPKKNDSPQRAQRAQRRGEEGKGEAKEIFMWEGSP
jgi:hypothetical protein